MELRVNGERRQVDADGDTPLLWVLRDELGLTGTKYGCGLEQCGACAVLCDGHAVLSCSTPASAFVGRELRTIEGVAENGVLHALQRAFVDEQAAQCGYCVPGIVVALVALLERTAAPGDAEVNEALAGHLCRCGAQPRMLRAVRRAARELATP
jgi:nicotinate dehydrogenase subunit A